MNSRYFGDSFDIVKRFFIGNIREMGYQVFVDPMFTDEWNELEKNKFYDFIGAAPLPLESLAASSGKTALLLDPDTGIGSKPTKKHVTVSMIVKCLQEHEIVFSFDQSFSRGGDALEQMDKKLSLLKKEGAAGFYYDSHARFLFSSKLPEVLSNLERHLVTVGLPEKRFINQ
jgi:hypothetical protein